MPPNNPILTGQAAIDQRNRDIAAYQASPYYKAPATTTPPPVSTSTVPPPATNIRRTPGLLDKAKEEALVTASSQRNIQRQADQYASTQRQARIDAINAAFAPRIAREEAEGAGRVDRVKAIAFKQGIIGSGVDSTKIGEQKTLNEDILRGIEEEKAILINDAFNAADKLSRERAETLTGEAKARAESNINLYKERADQALEALKLFGQAGTSLQDIESSDPNTIKTLREVSGLSDAQIDTLLKTSAPKDTYQWDEAQYVGNKLVVPKVLNGKITLESIEAPAGIEFGDGDWKFSPTIGTAGAWYNEKTRAMEFVVPPSTGGSGGGEGSSDVPQADRDEIARVKAQLLASKGITKQQRADLINLLDTQGLDGAKSWAYNNRLGAAEKETFDQYSNAQSAFQVALDDLAGSDIDTGPYKALFESSKPYLLLKRDKKYGQLLGLIEEGQAQLRKGFFGTAVTGTEAGNSKKFLITDSDTPDVIKYKLEQGENFLRFVNDAKVAQSLGIQKPDINSYIRNQAKTVTMVGPDGTFNVPADQVETFKQNGYTIK